MANWTTPHTWSSAEVVTAAKLNQYQRDNLQYLYDRYAVQSIAGNYQALWLPPGRWMLLATCQTEGAATCAINKWSGTVWQAQIQTVTSAKQAPSLIWYADVPNADAYSASASSGTVVQFIAVRFTV
jgi:hypothetical protein